MGHVTLTTPLLRVICHCYAETQYSHLVYRLHLSRKVCAKCSNLEYTTAMATSDTLTQWIHEIGCQCRDEQSSRLPALCTSRWLQKRRLTSLPTFSSFSNMFVVLSTRHQTGDSLFHGHAAVLVTEALLLRDHAWGTVYLLICDRWPAMDSSGEIEVFLEIAAHCDYDFVRYISTLTCLLTYLVYTSQWRDPVTDWLTSFSRASRAMFLGRKCDEQVLVHSAHSHHRHSHNQQAKDVALFLHDVDVSLSSVSDLRK